MNNTDKINLLAQGMAAKTLELEAMTIAYNILKDGFIADDVRYNELKVIKDDLQTQIDNAKTTPLNPATLETP